MTAPWAKSASNTGFPSWRTPDEIEVNGTLARIASVRALTMYIPESCPAYTRGPR
jgi:hypothetical protein